jgi:trimeric autotransporter adhesin
MHATKACLLALGLSFALGCGSSYPKGAANSPSPSSPAANISISPAAAVMGSPDLTLTVAATQQFPFTSADDKVNRVIWTASGTDTALETTFVSSSQLTALVPGPLLINLLQAKVRVEIWDVQGDAPIATSSSAPFSVTSTPIPTPSISSISPSRVAAGSADVTITIDGSNFGHYGHFDWSTAFWTTNGNLHDTGVWLQTTIISSSQLTAVIPAKLLESPTSVQIVVMNGDVMGMSDGYFGYPEAKPATFTVTL